MLVKLAQLKRDVSWHEDEIVRLLPGSDDVGENAQIVCGHFERILSAVFESLDKTLSWRYWCIDDFSCESIGHSETVVTLRGASYWLEGGENCEQFRLDVATNLDPLLYSCEFSKFTHGGTQKQALYVGKGPDGWKLGT